PAPQVPDASEPAATSEKRETIPAPEVRVPVIILAWRVPGLTHPDWFAVKRLNEILTARLNNALVKGAGVAGEIEAHLSNAGSSNLFWIALISAPGKDLSQLENLGLQEIERIARDGVPQDELDRFSTDALRS